MTSRRILLLNTVMEAGGAQKAIMQLARGLSDRGHEVTVAAMYDKTGSIPGYETAFGLPVLDLEMNPPGSRVRKALAMIRGAHRLRGLLRRNRVQVIQSFTHYSNILGPVVGWLAGTPVRVASQRMSLEDRAVWLRRADRAISRIGLAQRMVAVSDSVRRYCIEREGLNPDRVVTIPNGLDLSGWSEQPASATRGVRDALGLDASHILITTVARLAPQKGHSVLLDAIERIVPRWPSARFIWVGGGELADALARHVRDRRLEDRVRLLGTRRDVPDLLRASDLFVLSSLWEGMPNAILEAMAARLAVVATAVDGTPEVIVDGETGWLVPPGDPEALLGAIDEALGDVEGRARRGEAGRRRIEASFSFESYVRGFEALYEELLG
jgi:glycosyltransferase involved in cell wall biosynthesis